MWLQRPIRPAKSGRRTKSSSFGKAAEALEAWLAAGDIMSGAIFRRIPKGTTVGQPLLPAGVRKIVQDNFSAHSLRSGFVTEAGRQNIPLGDPMAVRDTRASLG